MCQSHSPRPAPPRSRSSKLFWLGLAATVLLASCAAPKVKELPRPVYDSPVLNALVDPAKLTPESQRYLQEQNLLQVYRSDPALAANTLRTRINAGAPPQASLALAEVYANTGDSLDSDALVEATGYHLAAAELTLPLALNSNNQIALDAYNFSCSRTAQLLFELRSGGSAATTTIPGPEKTYRIRRTLGKGYIDPSFPDEVWNAAALKLKGFDDLPRNIRPGFGAAMVGHRDGTAERKAMDAFLPVVGMSQPAAVTLDFKDNGTTVDLAIHDVMIKEKGTLGGQTVTLHADFTAPLATLFNYTPSHKVGWEGLLHPERYADMSGIFQFEPYRPDQIPVIFVHGLMSSPATWVKALNQMRADPVLRERYQLLAFSYPTGFPIGYNAAALRRELKQFQETYDPGRRNPNMRNMILIGHSMGGLLSSMQIRDSNDALIKKLFTRPLDELDSISDSEKDAITELLVYEANPDITRAIFIASPHRGSNIAKGFIGNLGSKLIKFSTDILTGEIIEPDVEGLTEVGQEMVKNRPDSIDGLKPRAPMLMTLLEQPVQGNTTIHSIIGNHNQHQPLEESGDSVVPYWSGHLDEVASEKVVHASHTTITGNADAIEETRRLLYIHAGLRPPSE
jgi:hypothetical protein